MEFKELIAKRRSVRKFTDREVPREVVDRILAEALSAPSARNTRTTRFLVVDDPALVARMAEMRDYGSAFLKGAPLAVLVLGDTSASDLWRENAAISATVLQLACVDEGLASCWVHVNGRPRRKDAPDGERAADYLRTFLPVPDGCEPLCAIALVPLPGCMSFRHGGNVNLALTWIFGDSRSTFLPARLASWLRRHRFH